MSEPIITTADPQKIHFGLMAEQVAAFDWANTPLGPRDTWPLSLKTAVSISLNCRFPMFVWWGPELIHIYNDGYAVILGKRHPSALGVPAHTIWPEVWPLIQVDLDAVMGRGEAFTRVRQHLILERNGYPEETYFTYSYSPIHDDDGTIGGFLQVCYEETEVVMAQRERERVIAQLEAERTNLNAIVEEAPAFIAVLGGPTYVFEVVNERYYTLVGRRDLIGKSLADALPEVVSQGFLGILDNVYRTGETYVGMETSVMLGPVGALEQHYVNFVYQAMHDADGKATGIFVHGVDITSAVRARQKAETAQQQRRLALDSAELGAWHVDFVTHALASDHRFREIFWGNDRAGTYEDAFDAIHPDDRDRVRVAIETSMNPQNPVPYEAEFRVVHPDGSIRWVLSRGRGSRSGVGVEPVQYSLDGTVADITDRKEREVEREHLLSAERAARAEAETTGRIKDEFLATLSHEIRTPLNAILGWSQIMQQSARPEDITNGLAVIERNARAQAQIIEDLLDMSSIISGKVRLDVQRLNLADIVSHAVETARPTAEAKRIKLQSVIDPLLGVEVSGDPNRLQQVMWNLISNAIKFTPRDGKVRVLLERANSHLEITVADSGEGITPEFLPYVFDRFRQADASTTRRHGGLGIGLSIVRQLAELHGGTVRVHSAGVNQGATFVVALPLMVVTSTEEAPVRQHPRVSAVAARLPRNLAILAGVRVLVIDDEPDARALLKRLLEEYGAAVIETVSADMALAHVENGEVDVLVSDVGMPGEDGYSLIRRIRKLGAGRHGNVPAIAFTAYARAEDRVRAINAGFQMHIAKPAEPIELITMIASAAGRRVMETES